MKLLQKPLILLPAGVLALAAAGILFYLPRLRTAASIEKLSSYDADYNLYGMEVLYDYDLDRVLAADMADTQDFVEAVLAQALPLLPVRMEAPDFGCSAFCVQDTAGSYLMGRNYDFARDTSAMLVHCTPKDGYSSVGFAALDNLSANAPQSSLAARLSCLAAPFVCLDGMNEKGVSIAVLTLDSAPTVQHTGRQTIATTLAIRLVLDRAATTQEAVQLLSGYDMLALSGRDYHFYITDASGDGRVLEYDCEDEARPLVVTPTRTVTNFFILHQDKVLPNRHNGIYGHGRERYDAIEKLLTENEGAHTPAVAWEALRAAAQEPREGEATSNTQWSILFHNTERTLEFSLHRDWDRILCYDLTANRVQTEA